MEFILFSWTSLFFGYLFSETYHTLKFEFIQKISSFFSLRVLCTALFWNLGFFISQTMFLVFWQRQLLIRLHPLRNKRQLIYFHSLKVHLMLIFSAGSSSVPNMVEGLLLCWGPPMPISACNDRVEWRKDGLSPFSLFCLLLSSADSCLLPSSADGQMY